ncbi:MAG: hypothetical protein EOO81_02135, partial [Oxalobacteraceae bacterium]
TSEREGLFESAPNLLHAVDSEFRPFRDLYISSDDSDSTDSSTDYRLEAAKERHGLPESRHDTSLLKLLLFKPGIDANKKDWRGRTALMSAVESSQSQNAQALLAWPGIDLAARDDSGKTALAIVTERTPPPVVEALLAAHGIKASYQQYMDRHREFTAAAAAGNLSQLRSLAVEMPWININFVVNGESALGSAVNNAHLETIMALVAMPGIFVSSNIANLMAELAIEKGHFQLLRDMLERPIFYDIQKASTFRFYLNLAAANGCFPIVQMLLSSPEINGTVGHDKGEHALFNATIHEHHQIAIALAAMPWINANPSMKESFYSGKYHGYPVLAVAAEKGNLSLVRALLAVPAIDVNLVTDSGHTPLMLAAYYGHLDIVQALLAMPGIDIKKSSQCLPYRGDSPEHISGARVGRSPFAPRTYYSALRLAKLSNEQRIVEALLASARPVRSETEETDAAISDADTTTSPLSPPREQLDPQRASWLEQGCMDISRGTCLASDVQLLLQSAIPLPAWCQSSLVEAIALAFTAGHYRAAPAPLWRTLRQTRAWLAGLAFGAKQSRQDVIELDTAISHQLESMKLWNVFLNEVDTEWRCPHCRRRQGWPVGRVRGVVISRRHACHGRQRGLPGAVLHRQGVRSHGYCNTCPRQADPLSAAEGRSLRYPGAQPRRPGSRKESHGPDLRHPVQQSRILGRVRQKHLWHSRRTAASFARGAYAAKPPIRFVKSAGPCNVSIGECGSCTGRLAGCQPAALALA